MTGRLHACPVPGCQWSWRELRRPVGQGPEFDRRLAQRARMRAEIQAEHRRECHPECQGEYGPLDGDELVSYGR